MKVTITGGGGFLGRKLAQRLCREGRLVDRSGQLADIEQITLLDQISPPEAELKDPRVRVMLGDITDNAVIAEAITQDTDSVFHLAAVVSAGAEADFDLGYAVNLRGTTKILDRCRALPHLPRVVFASSVAVYGGDLPECVDDATPLRPETSYGVQKATGELLINDYTRKSYINGRAMRLPTIVVRPGKPNKAASGFASGIIREPLAGVDMACPVRPDSCMAEMSPRRVIDAFYRLHELDGDALGRDRTVLLPGLKVSMADAAEAVGRVGGNRKLGEISFEIDPDIQRIVDAWPWETRSERADALGFVGDESIEDIVRYHIEDELDRVEQN